MLRGLYLASTGMLVQEMRQDVISNNLANATTGGFKSAVATVRSFPEMLLQRLEKNQATPIGPFSPGVMVDNIYTNTEPGPLTETGHATDLALVQPGVGVSPAFFVVRTPGGEAYTRNGQFQVDPGGRLVTAEGYPVQGQNGDIYVGTTDFKVDAGGRILVNGQVVDQLRVVTFANPALLQRQGDTLFTAPGAQALPAANFQVKQGWLEESNVELARELVDMLAVLRSYEANQKVIQTEDQTLAKSANEVGSLR
ncbi:flagellar basal-body rod protein FlgF [Neomoorella thermoacetica]|uniref:flagellar basal-body rod protein FlgF n=1 Tax=Neomoorella thermoacetica TaxID=1525 RepID=UPI0008FB3146|nr:flagellar basal-body rod protein FlgF [Moorella thermoacetica]OIQ55657.1 flagellar basal-body rod protein FlgG [Moorella thermoacetica]OIQ61963.1 flagellar basal-body rod protein FlgG [Moorella thermoacetica]